MLNVLPDAHHFARAGELTLHCLERQDGAGAVALAEQVEREETREVLQSPQGLVTAGCGKFRMSEFSFF